jgi:drug/metabolite transporter (DMT)-like permease
MTKRNLALLAATLVSIIYGMTFTIAKDVMPQYLDAYGFIVLRVGGATLLFWLVWILMKLSGKIPTEKISRSDVPRIIAAAFFGIAVNMLCFFKGLSLTSPISAAVIMVSTPMIVLVLSAIILKERMRKRMITGLLLGLIGTTFLILYGKSVGSASNAGSSIGQSTHVIDCSSQVNNTRAIANDGQMIGTANLTSKGGADIGSSSA